MCNVNHLAIKTALLCTTKERLATICATWQHFGALL